MSGLPSINVVYPSWVAVSVDWERSYRSLDERMRLAIGLARENVDRGTGGPFGAAVFESESGNLVAVGMNLVVSNHNPLLHAEMVAFMMAGKRLSSFSLGADGMTAHELVTSCDPCAMCLGAVLWSGVKRVVCGAVLEDARRMGFDEGPVFPESYRYLEKRGVEIVREVLRAEAVEVMRLYRERGGMIYNA